MARILICHVPKDGSTARELGAALMGRGHVVSFDGEPDTPRDDRAARLRQFESVVVIWTEGSVQSAGLADIAREALPVNALVPVRNEELDRAKLPLTFRKLNMFAPRDVDGIARLVARLSTAATSLRSMAAMPPYTAPPRAEKVLPRVEKPAADADQAHETSPKGRSETGSTSAASAHASAPTFAHAQAFVPPPAAVPAQAQAQARAPAASSASPGPSPTPLTRNTDFVPPVMRQAHQPLAKPPIVEAGANVKARPLSDLPEVSDPYPAPVANPAPEPAIAAHAPAAAGLSRAAELNATLNAQRAPRDVPRPATTAADIAHAIDRGLLVSRIPDSMWLGEPVPVEITIGRGVLARLFPEQAAAADGGNASPDRHGLETLSISLYGHTDVFEIERQSERTQFVVPRQAGRDSAAFGRWTWLVTPQAAGRQELVVRISALLRDRHGVPEPVALPDRRFEIVIDVPEGADLVPGLMGWQRT